MKKQVAPFFCVALLVICATCASAQISWDDYRKKSDAWFRSEEGGRAADNILSWQSPRGSWPSEVDTAAKAFTGDREKLRGTFDDHATTNELRFLARALRVTQEARYQKAFLHGLDHILQAQYANGGWPQFFPPNKKYPRYITFNDNAMVRLMELLREVATSRDYEFVDAARRKAAESSFDRGIGCILKCQVIVEGKLSVWCAQHDEVDFQPRPARSFELASLSGSESAGILQLLMSLDAPSPEVVRAIEAGAAWFESAKLTGIRQTKVDGNKVVIKAADAPPLWARFYEIGTNRPIFAGRDGVKKYDIAEIDAERRNNYSWYGIWGERVARDYARWKEKRNHAGARDSFIVATDGSGDFQTIQSAVNAAPTGRTAPFIIRLKAGIYKEHVIVPKEKPFLVLRGEDASKTVIADDKNQNTVGVDGRKLSDRECSTVLILANDFTAENVTFENTTGVGVQALAVFLAADRAAFRNCRFLGWQDTLRLDIGRVYLQDCFIAGHVDFIYGDATAVFDRCVLHSKADGCITAASTKRESPFGFVFFACRVTAEPSVKNVLLGRPWRPFAHVTWMNTELPAVIAAKGWDNWQDAENEKTARFAEYRSLGAGANPAARVPWSRQLTDAEAKVIAPATVLQGKDGWNPTQ